MRKEENKPIEGLNVRVGTRGFRLLEADEIECRVGQGGNERNPGWCSLLLYKDARCDIKRLEETYGQLWERSHQLIGDNLYCTVSVYEDGIGWIRKQDVGTPSNTEPVKGQASDSFKRACVNLGIGIELYSAPKIFIKLNPNTEYSQTRKLTTVFHVGFVNYDKKHNISQLIIQDQKNIVRYYYGMEQGDVQKWLKNQTEDNGHSEPAPKDDDSISDLKNYAYPQLEQAQDWTDVDKCWAAYEALQSLWEFKERCIRRKLELSTTKSMLKAVYNEYPDLQGNQQFLALLTQYKTKVQ